VPFVFTLFILGCATAPTQNAYDSATPEQIKSFKRERLPFPANIKLTVSQGAFGKKSHMEPGNEYSWDFDVPYGTSVVSVENGTVLEVWEPNGGGGCDPKFKDVAHNIKIEHEDGSVAQYVHVSSKVKPGDQVREGEEIGVTAMNGWICSPQLHFGIYKSKNNLYNSPKRETIPVVFDGLPNSGKALEGTKAMVSGELEILPVNSSPEEHATVKLMNELAKKYDLSPYYFTKKIQVEKFAIPHDYPILTLNTRHNSNPDMLLSTFLHEEIHRFLSGPNDQKTQKAINDLRKRFNHVPVGGVEGGKDEESTYLHLLVCWFELQADKNYLGNEKAYDIIKKADHYAWIYKQVLAHEKEIAKLIRKHGLSFYPAVEVFASNFSKVKTDMLAVDSKISEMNHEFDKVPANPKSKNWIKTKLKHMVKVDQFVRVEAMNIPFKNGYSDEERNEFQYIMVSRFKKVDSANTKDLKELLKIYPWFTISQFAKDSDKDAWLLVQHADLDSEFQKDVLKVLAKLASQHETNLSNYAYLVDRVQSSFGDPAKRVPQTYGTQGSCVGVGKWEPLPVEDPINLDKRRSKVGLPPESEYIKVFKNICH